MAFESNFQMPFNCIHLLLEQLLMSSSRWYPLAVSICHQWSQTLVSIDRVKSFACWRPVRVGDFRPETDWLSGSFLGARGELRAHARSEPATHQVRPSVQCAGRAKTASKKRQSSAQVSRTHTRQNCHSTACKRESVCVYVFTYASR